MLQVDLNTQNKRKVRRVTGHSTLPPAVMPGDVVWQWENDEGGLTPYAPHVIKAIEQAYALKQAKFDIPQSSFRIVFYEMIQVRRARIFSGTGEHA